MRRLAQLVPYDLLSPEQIELDNTTLNVLKDVIKTHEGGFNKIKRNFSYTSYDKLGQDSYIGGQYQAQTAKSSNKLNKRKSKSSPKKRGNVVKSENGEKNRLSSPSKITVKKKQHRKT